MNQVKSVITLCSGKVIDKPILEPCKKDDESISEGKEGVESEHCKKKKRFPASTSISSCYDQTKESQSQL
jgi:hypothetical protein